MKKIFFFFSVKCQKDIPQSKIETHLTLVDILPQPLHVVSIQKVLFAYDVGTDQAGSDEPLSTCTDPIQAVDPKKNPDHSSSAAKAQ